MASKNLAWSTVATAPSPAASGTSLVVGSGHGVRFPSPAADGPFKITVWDATATPYPTTSSAEIMLCTGRIGDTLAVVRAQEGTTARTVTVGDVVSAGQTAEMLDTTTTAAVLALYQSGIGRL